MDLLKASGTISSAFAIFSIVRRTTYVGAPDNYFDRIALSFALLFAIIAIVYVMIR